MSGNSNVGNRSLYESGDQVNVPRDQIQHENELRAGGTIPAPA